ncbi:hypothetical protein J6590_052750 [Homalodisca vitripennis]|nr:hypothetical protein J6590_052750 [Homalodisca vitripennis]
MIKNPQLVAVDSILLKPEGHQRGDDSAGWKCLVDLYGDGEDDNLQTLYGDPFLGSATSEKIQLARLPPTLEPTGPTLIWNILPSSEDSEEKVEDADKPTSVVELQQTKETTISEPGRNPGILVRMNCKTF